ncbi:MAG: FliM/FliN family flagellar motor switch protein [Pseudomonadota bacterium]
MAAKKTREKAKTTKPVKHSFVTHDRTQIDVQPMLKRVVRPMRKTLAAAMATLGAGKLIVEAGDVYSSTSAEWFDGAAEPCAYSLYQLAPVKGAAVLRLDADLVAALVDTFFGGAIARPTREISEFSRTELRLIHRLADIFSQELGKSWAAQGAFRCSMAGICTDPEDAQTAAPTAVMIIQPLVLVYGEEIRFTVEIAYPLDMAQSAKEIATPVQSDNDAADRDPVWDRALASSLNNVHLPVRSVLARPEMTLPELAQLKAGDTIPIPPARNLPLLIGDKIFARGSMGEQNGMAAFRIDQIEKG